MKDDENGKPDAPFDLERFLSAQEGVYERALGELKNGAKRSHWMWFIFPQIDGLAHSAKSKYYAIKSREEAQQYFEHPVLGPRLLECAQAVYDLEGRTLSEIFGYPDDLKFVSCMTLFMHTTEPGSIFMRVLDKYNQGGLDLQTLLILKEMKGLP